MLNQHSDHKRCKRRSSEFLDPDINELKQQLWDQLRHRQRDVRSFMCSFIHDNSFIHLHVSSRWAEVLLQAEFVFYFMFNSNKSAWRQKPMLLKSAADLPEPTQNHPGRSKLWSTEEIRSGLISAGLWHDLSEDTLERCVF